MKELAFDISVFNKGLRPYHKSTKEFQLYDLKNFKPTDFGLVPYEPVVNPMPTAVIEALTDEVHPYPQIFIGKKYNLIACKDKIFMCDRLDWSSPIQLDIYDAANPTSAFTITPGSVWSFADFWDTWFLTNGVSTVFMCGKDWISSSSTKVYGSSAVPIGTALAHKGRVLFGGFDPNTFYSARHETFLTSWQTKTYNTGLNLNVSVDGSDKLAPINQSFVWWSSIGGGDALLFFLPANVLESGFLTSTYGATKPFLLDMLRQNTQGMAPMPMQGKVQSLMDLGDHVIAYSEEGVTALTPVTNPEPTYKITKLNCGGIACKSAVAGSSSIHLFVDNSGMLCAVTPDLQVKPVGYREFFFPMLGTDILVSHAQNPIDNDGLGEFFICNDSKSYRFGSKGLMETTQKVRSAHYFLGATIGSCSVVPSESEEEGTFGIDANDLGLSGIKTIDFVSLDFDEINMDTSVVYPTLQVSIDYRHSKTSDDSWHSTGWVTVNKEGIAHITATGITFRIKVKVSNYGNFEFTKALVGVKAGDKRFKRYLQVDQVNSG
jgi:hypothetical protein